MRCFPSGIQLGWPESETRTLRTQISTHTQIDTHFCLDGWNFSMSALVYRQIKTARLSDWRSVSVQSRDKVSPQFWFGFHVLIVLFIDWPLKSSGVFLRTSRLRKLYRHGSLRDFEPTGRRVDLAKFAAP